MQIDNFAADGIENDNIHKKYQRYGYLVLLVTRYNPQGPLQHALEIISTNLADCFTKHFPHCLHHQIRLVYLNFTGNSNNENVGVCYSSKNTSQKQD